MGLATIRVVPSTPEEFRVWSFSHMAHHRDIVRRVYETLGIRLDEYVLDPFDPLDMGSWPYQHQQMHQQMDAALGLAGYDLSEIDWRDEGALLAWFSQNADEHYRAGALLGLG